MLSGRNPASSTNVMEVTSNQYKVNTKVFYHMQLGGALDKVSAKEVLVPQSVLTKGSMI